MPNGQRHVAACLPDGLRSSAWLDTLTEQQAKKYYRASRTQRGHVVQATMDYIREHVALQVTLKHTGAPHGLFQNMS